MIDHNVRKSDFSTIERYLGQHPRDVVPNWHVTPSGYNSLFRFLERYVSLVNPEVDVWPSHITELARELHPVVTATREQYRNACLKVNLSEQLRERFGDQLHYVFRVIDGVVDRLSQPRDSLQALLGIEELLRLELEESPVFYFGDLFEVADPRGVRPFIQHVLDCVAQEPTARVEFVIIKRLCYGSDLMKSSSPINWKSPEPGAVVIIEKRADVDAVVIAGYASPEIRDKDNQRIPISALQKAFKGFMRDPRFRNVMVNHRNAQVGVVLDSYVDVEGRTWTSQVDDVGLFVVCEVRTDVKMGRDVAYLIRKGVLKSFSIGGEALARRYVCDSTSCWWDIIDLDLHEVTICQEGKNVGAKFIIVKAEDSDVLSADSILLKQDGTILDKGRPKGPADLEGLVPEEKTHRGPHGEEVTQIHWVKPQDVEEPRWEDMSLDDFRSWVDTQLTDALPNLWAEIGKQRRLGDRENRAFRDKHDYVGDLYDSRNTSGFQEEIKSLGSDELRALYRHFNYESMRLYDESDPSHTYYFENPLTLPLSLVRLKAEIVSNEIRSRARDSLKDPEVLQRLAAKARELNMQFYLYEVEDLKFVFQSAEGTQASTMKHEIAMRLSANLERDVASGEVPSDLVAELASATRDQYGTDAPGFGDEFDDSYIVANRFIMHWSESAADAHAPSLAMQQVASEIFLEPGRAETIHIDERLSKRPALARETREFADRYRPIMRSILQSQYAFTQQLFREKGISHLTLFRGASLPGSVVDNERQSSGFDQDDMAIVGRYRTQPISSFTSDIDTALSFAGYGIAYDDASREEQRRATLGIVRVPVERVLSTALTGYGSMDESEVTVLGGLDPAVMLDVSGLGAPEPGLAAPAEGVHLMADFEDFLEELSRRLS